MSTLRNLAALVFVLASATPSLAQPREKDDGTYFLFKDGDVIVVMGDSITEQHLYSNYLEAWSVCRFPKRNLTFRNVGIGGDRSPGGNSRFKRDVLAHKATVLTVDFGMNDAGYNPKFDEKAQKAFQIYMKGLEGIANQAKDAKIRVAWITPQPIEKKEQGPAYQGYNETLEKFSDGVREIAHRYDGLFVDQFHPYLAVLAKARAIDPKNTRIMSTEKNGDAVHPGPAGQVVMASAILKALDFQRLVSSVAINLNVKEEKGNEEKAKDEKKAKTEKKMVEKAKDKKLAVENCEIKSLKMGDHGLSFTRLDFALPFFPEQAESILQWTPIRDDMNRYGLKVVGLAPGKYAFNVNDEKLAEYAAEDLAKGVNVAAPMLASGPVADQVKKVWTAVKEKNKYFHDQVFRGVVLANAKSAAFKDVDSKDIEARRQALYVERMQKLPELDAAVRRTLEMKAYTVSLVPLGK